MRFDNTGPADREGAEAVLRRLAGEGARLRNDQWTAIEALVQDRRRALVVQRTGWGKSAVYFAATALLRARGSGPTLIVSPPLALMRNQRQGVWTATVRAWGHSTGRTRATGSSARETPLSPIGAKRLVPQLYTVRSEATAI